MNVKRCEFPEAPIELIERLAGNYFFSSTAFAKLWKSMGGKPVYWLAEENGQVIAILPGVEFGKGILRRFQSMPNGCYGQILYNDKSQNNRDEISKLLMGQIREAGYTRIFLNDFYNTMVNPQQFEQERATTYIVDISSPQWQPPDSKLRQQIHKAEKEGLNIEPFNASRHMTGFKNLVKLHEMRRDTKSRYSQAFFEALAKLPVKDDRIQWVWCEHDAKPVASSIFFREGNSILHWQMYYDEVMSQFQATKYIPYQIAKQAQKEGITILNLGASPPDAEGVEFYKSKWGGETFNYNSYIYKSFLGRLW